MIRRATITLAAAVAGMGVPLTASADDEIVIGLAVARSGFMTAYDLDATDMILLWIDDQNAKGGLLGKQLKGIVSDTKSDRAQGARSGQEVINAGAVLVGVTCDYDYGAPAAAAAQRADLMSLFICAEDPKAGVQGAGPYAFTSSIAAQVQGATAAEWGQEALDVNSYYILLDTTLEYNKSVCAGFEWAADRIGLESLGADSYKNDDPSIQAQITRIANLDKKPDALVLCGVVPGTASAIRQLRAADLDMPIFAGSASEGTFWTDAVPNLNDLYIPVQAAVHGNDPRPEVNDLVKRFEAKFDRSPANTYAVPAYAFMDLWARAVEKAGSTDAKDVVPIMEQYTDEETMIGPKTFNATHHIQLDAEMQILRYVDGKPEVVDNHRLAEPLSEEVLYRLH